MIPAIDVLIAVKWLGALYLCSTLGVLLFIKAGAYSPLRYSFGKAIGVIGVAGITWFLSIFKIMAFTPTSIFIVLLVGYVTVIFLRKKQIVESFKKHWREYLAVEVIFLGLFILGIAVRALIPKIEGIEKFMDAAIVSNLMRHDVGPPVDTWYAPNAINYYYFGHWIIASLAKISSTTIGYVFSLGFASSLAITGTSIYCLGWQLSKKHVGGFLALFLALFASNLHPFISIITGTQNYFFYNSGRFIEEVINEYPLYSIILGDLHAHMLSLMVSTALYSAVVLLLIERKFKTQLFLAVLAGVITGLLGATNSFDVIAGGLVFGLALLWLLWRKHQNLKNTAIIAITYLVSFVVILQIFMLNFKPAVGGLAFSLFKTPMIHMFWQFGALLILIIIGLLTVHKRKQSQANLKKIEIATILIIAGVILMMIPQFVYFKDIYFYQNPPFARANTVFKIWYASWPLLAIGASVLTVHAVNGFKKRNIRFIGWFLISAICLVLSFGTYSGIGTLNDQQPNTIDGIKYLKILEPEKYEVIKWVGKNIDGQPLVAQASGESYTQQSWLSSYTGLPSIIGWRSHEWGWRYSEEAWDLIGQRSDALKRLYEATTPSDLRQAVSQLGIDYVLIGQDERAVYSINDSVLISTFGEPVYSNPLYQIYSTR